MKIVNFLAVFFLTISDVASAQLEATIPDHIFITTNDSSLTFQPKWLESLHANLYKTRLLYSIVAYHANGEEYSAKLRLPQTLTKTQVIEQVILYYCLLRDHRRRERETVLIYPFFVDVADTPRVVCACKKGGQFYFQFYDWKTVARPPEPSKAEKLIFNEILSGLFEDTQNMESIPDGVFERVGNRNKLEVDSVKSIYRKVHLWQNSE